MLSANAEAHVTVPTSLKLLVISYKTAFLQINLGGPASNGFVK